MTDQNPSLTTLEPSQIDQMTYEQAFNLLEEIVGALESGEHSLEEALQLFEHGQALARRCAALLDQAEIRVQQIVGEQLLPFAPGEAN